MKKYLYAILAIACCFSTYSFAYDKVYINSKDVMVANNGIYLNFDDNVIQVSGISFDENGIYFESPDLNSIPTHQAWICPNKNCLHHNISWNKQCSKCGGSPPDYRKDKK